MDSDFREWHTVSQSNLFTIHYSLLTSKQKRRPYEASFCFDFNQPFSRIFAKHSLQ